MKKPISKTKAKGKPAKPAAKKTVPAKKVSHKPAVKSGSAKKPAAKKTPLKKPAAKKPVAKKTAVKKPAAKKGVAKKVAVKKTVTQKASATQASVKKTAAKTKATPPQATKKSSSAVPTKKTTAAPSSSAKNVSASVNPAAKNSSAMSQATPTSLAADAAKKSPRAAKAVAMMPPPPGQVVASTSAKSSYMPMAAPSLPVVVPVAPVKDLKLANNWRSKSPDAISDEEALAMPDDEYMNAFQLAFFRFKLNQLRHDILANAGETTEHLREDTVIVPDPADRATIEEEHALELRTRDRERKLLKKIEQSIAKIEAGDYGYCDETGEPIGVGRLLARPTATLSLEAQQRRELKQKMFGD